jgi:hypothetical protein
MVINQKTFKEMKRSNIKYLLMAVLAVALGACADEPMVVLNPDATIAPVASENEVVLTQEAEGTDALNISWTKPEFGFTASPSYLIYLDEEGGDFSTPVIVNNAGEITKTFKSEELNKHLINLGFEPGVSKKLQIKVEGKLGTYTSLVSDVISIDATAYTSFLDLSSTWGVVGSGYNNWGAFPDAPFFTTSTANVLVAYATLKDGEIKFRENNAWDSNYGDDGGDGTLESGGANIAVTAGTYKITFNTSAKTYTIEPYSWGIVGSAYNNWGETPDFNFTYDDATNQWRAVVKLLDGEFKIRKNSAWDVNYGDTGADGTLEAGGDNIAVTAGNYIVTFNEKDLTVEIESIPVIWGLVGSAYNNWGATPDAAFDRDWRNDDVWILRNVTLLDGEFKFRANNDWGTNYGDTGANGSLEAGGDNIISTAGVYTITLDLSDPDSPKWSSVKY